MPRSSSATGRETIVTDAFSGLMNSFERTVTVPRLNGPATAGETISKPNGAPPYGPVMNTFPPLSTYGSRAEPRDRGRFPDLAVGRTRIRRGLFSTAQHHRRQQRRDPRRQMHRDRAERLITIRTRQFQIEARERTSLPCSCSARQTPARTPSGLPGQPPPPDTRADFEFFGRRAHVHRPRARPRRERRLRADSPRSAPGSRPKPAPHRTVPASVLQRAPAARCGNVVETRSVPSFSFALPRELHEHTRHRVFSHDIQRHQRAERVPARFPVRRRRSQIHRAFKFMRQQRRLDMHRPHLRRVRTRRSARR